MSSQNSNNEFENLDEMLSDADGAPLEMDMNPFGDGVSTDDFQTDDSASVGINENELPAGETAFPTDDVPLTEEVTSDNSNDVAEEPQVQYKKVHCWDMYSILLFIAWLALLGGIAILYFECPPNEYGNPPYKESSTPVKTVQQ